MDAREKPTGEPMPPRFYLFRYSSNDIVEAVQVGGPYDEQLFVYWCGSELRDPLKDVDGEWYGPIQPPGAPLTDEEASQALHALREETGRFIGGVWRPLDDDDKPLPSVVTLDADFDLPTLRAIVAILERVKL